MASPSSSADLVFAAWLASTCAPPFESVLLAHPTFERELRAFHDHWVHIEPLLRLAGVDPAATFAERLKAKHGDAVDPKVELDPPEVGSATSNLIHRLGKKSTGSRYRLEGEVARGGMGAILRVWDEDIRRHLAMKVVLGKGEGVSGDSSEVDPRLLARFLEEAQVTGQLDHPGIVPVHELGIDAGGRVFFTMKLVKGRDLRTIYDLVFEGKEGWNETRALSVLLKVCEAVAYAHKKGVIHRDLKPANVMVGDFGEVYVMDWGLARVTGRADRHDMRVAPESASSKSVRTERREEREETPDSPLVTMDGSVVGTPAYMPPEQARGEVDQLGQHSDVYAIGAMLYHLLARQMPFVPRNVRVSAHTVLMRVLEGPPKSLAEIAPRAPAELVSICEKAMARDSSSRYRSMLDLAGDIRAYLEGRVVTAHANGPFVELRKWVRRHPAAAAWVIVPFILAITLAFALNFVAYFRHRIEMWMSVTGSGIVTHCVSGESWLDEVSTFPRDDFTGSHWISAHSQSLSAWSCEGDGLVTRRKGLDGWHSADSKRRAGEQWSVFVDRHMHDVLLAMVDYQPVH